MTGYPKNICVHGNGFVQISLGGDPQESRVHIWHPDLPDCQNVNTAIHNHRFGFVSTVLRGYLYQIEVRPEVSPIGEYSLWNSSLTRMPNGNRPLVREADARYDLLHYQGEYIGPDQAYYMEPMDFHITDIGPSCSIVVTLMQKTRVLSLEEYQAAVLCPVDLEPDQEFDRFQVPFGELEKIIGDALSGTVFDDVQLW